MWELDENNISDEIDNEWWIINQEWAKYSLMVNELLDIRNNMK